MAKIAASKVQEALALYSAFPLCIKEKFNLLGARILDEKRKEMVWSSSVCSAIFAALSSAKSLFSAVVEAELHRCCFSDGGLAKACSLFSNVQVLRCVKSVYNDERMCLSTVVADGPPNLRRIELSVGEFDDGVLQKDVIAACQLAFSQKRPFAFQIEAPGGRHFMAYGLLQNARRKWEKLERTQREHTRSSTHPDVQILLIYMNAKHKI